MLSKTGFHRSFLADFQLTHRLVMGELTMMMQPPRPDHRLVLGSEAIWSNLGIIKLCPTRKYPNFIQY